MTAIVSWVPELSRFFGMVVGMFYREHGVPHFHVVYADYRASIEVESLIVRGGLPPRAAAMALEWARQHRAELLENWELAREGRPLRPIAPLE